MTWINAWRLSNKSSWVNTSPGYSRDILILLQMDWTHGHRHLVIYRRPNWPTTLQKALE